MKNSKSIAHTSNDLMNSRTTLISDDTKPEPKVKSTMDEMTDIYFKIRDDPSYRPKHSKIRYKQKKKVVISNVSKSHAKLRYS